ncbi:1,4-alpha-glucan branching enzyme [Streptacidiphilus sp. MAP12-20]|uniref:isoamylase early set domain-containing protein n=1 Tax=Streptacidiphilus sp. MAP12-20 TaxID=3156299 RepID=UPI00351442C0
MLERTQTDDNNRTQITFVLPPDHPAGEVSVVGDFNNWQPGAHPLLARTDGYRAVRVALPAGERLSFRYLAHGDYWFDDETADAHDGRNGILHT